MITVKDNIIKLDFHEETLHCDIYADGTKWIWQHNYQPYFKYNGKDVLFSEAKTISHKRYDTGIGFGLVSHYENFEQVPELCFETYIWIELSTGDVHFEWIPITEPVSGMDEVVWPGAMDFKCDSEDWYTLLNWGQGLLIPNGWETTLGKVPFDGRMCTEGSYMPWFSQIKDRNGYIAICEQPEDAGYRAAHESGEAQTSVGMVLYKSLGSMRYRRTLLYHFEKDCDYNTMCKFYRNYTKEQGTFHTLREKAARADVEKLVGSMFVHAGIKTLVQPESRFFDPEAPEKNNHLTPFAVRTKQIRHCYEKLGIKKLYLHLDGWGDPGYDNEHPDYLPACIEAGGWEGMKELCDTIHECGYVFGIHDQYRDYYFRASTYDKSSAIHLEDGSIPSHANWAGGNQTYLCATQAPYYVKRNFLELAAHDIKLDCAYLDVFTCNEPDECFEPHHKMTRKECLEFRSRCFAYLLSQNILSSSEEVADWSVANLVFCHYAPYDFMMRRPEEPKQGIPVPLFNLVYHDCVIIPWMMEKHENEDYMLYALINGGAPYFDRNGAYNGTDGAFGAGSDFTEEEQKKRCEQVASLHEHVAYSELVSHRILDKTGLRQQSTFADGTCVEVDFSKGTYKITVNG